MFFMKLGGNLINRNLEFDIFFKIGWVVGLFTVVYGCYGIIKYFTAEVLRRFFACCMSIKVKMAEFRDLEDGDLEFLEEEEDEEGFIRYYFFRGFEYKEIFLFLFKNYGIEMSLSILKRRIK